MNIQKKKKLQILFFRILSISHYTILFEFIYIQDDLNELHLFIKFVKTCAFASIVAEMVPRTSFTRFSSTVVLANIDFKIKFITNKYFFFLN